MSSQLAIPGQALARGLRTEFTTALVRTYPGLQARIGRHMRLALPSDKRTELYFTWNNAPHPERIPDGNPIPKESFDGDPFTITNVDWGKGIDWKVKDREDDQTQGLMGVAQELGRNFVFMNERVFFQIITAASNPLLLEGIPLAIDLVSLYSATDADGDDRYGQVGGNLISGSGVATPQDVSDDIWEVVERFKGFLGTKLIAPFWDPSIIDRGITLYHSVSNIQVVREALKQDPNVTIIQNVAATENVAAAAPQNSLTVQVSGVTITNEPTTFISDNSLYAFLDDAPDQTKAVIEQNRTEIREFFFDANNSRELAEKQKEEVMWHTRKGYGVGHARATIKINNP